MEGNNAGKAGSNNSRTFADGKQKQLFRVRKVQKAKKPVFRRTNHHKFQRLDSNWRRPRGLQGKQRRHYKAKGAIARAGYGSPKFARGLHPSGYGEVLVNNLKEIETVDAETEAVRISAGVGALKKALIESRAAEMGIRILNPSGGNES
jgi:large subunit ribosomal protein L32e